MSLKTLNIFGYIGDPFSYSEDPAIIDTDIKAELKDLSDYDELEVHINSYGGIATQGIGIFNIIRAAINNAKKVKPNFKSTAYVEGIAASAASIIFCACENRIMRVGSQLMIHNALTIMYGNSHDLRKEAEVLDQYDLSIAAIYAKVGSKSSGEFLAMMKDETYFIAEEAVECGLATSIDAETESVLSILPFAKGNYSAFMHRAAMSRSLPQIKAETEKKIETSVEKKKATADAKAKAKAFFALAEALR